VLIFVSFDVSYRSGHQPIAYCSSISWIFWPFTM